MRRSVFFAWVAATESSTRQPGVGKELEKLKPVEDNSCVNTGAKLLLAGSVCKEPLNPRRCCFGRFTKSRQTWRQWAGRDAGKDGYQAGDIRRHYMQTFFKTRRKKDRTDSISTADETNKSDSTCPSDKTTFHGTCSTSPAQNSPGDSPRSTHDIAAGSYTIVAGTEGGTVISFGFEEDAEGSEAASVETSFTFCNDSRRPGCTESDRPTHSEEMQTFLPRSSLLLPKDLKTSSLRSQKLQAQVQAMRADVERLKRSIPQFRNSASACALQSI